MMLFKGHEVWFEGNILACEPSWIVLCPLVREGSIYEACQVHHATRMKTAVQKVTPGMRTKRAKKGHLRIVPSSMHLRLSIVKRLVVGLSSTDGLW